MNIAFQCLALTVSVNQTIESQFYLRNAYQLFSLRIVAVFLLNQRVQCRVRAGNRLAHLVRAKLAPKRQRHAYQSHQWSSYPWSTWVCRPRTNRTGLGDILASYRRPTASALGHSRTWKTRNCGTHKRHSLQANRREERRRGWSSNRQRMFRTSLTSCMSGWQAWRICQRA